MREIIIGAMTMGFAVAGMFFLRFWRETHDRLFAFFALAFFVLAVNRLGFAFVSDSRDDYLYWARLVAFLIILLAVVDKNIMRTARGG
jgi:hypothetical protein